MTIKHIMADGTALDCIEGLMIPNEGRTGEAYRLMTTFIKRTIESKEMEEKEDERSA